MNIYEYIKKDHKKVAHLFKQFGKTESKERKKEIVNFIAQELLVHLESEQATFYKALENYPESRSSALHGGEEHNDIETQLNAILGASTINSAWDKKVLKLKEIVEHHVQEEENIIHKQAKKLLSEEKAMSLKEQMHEYKKTILMELNNETPATVEKTNNKKFG